MTGVYTDVLVGGRWEVGGSPTSMPGSFWNMGGNIPLCPQLLEIWKTNAILVFIILLIKTFFQKHTSNDYLFFIGDYKDILPVLYLLSLTHWGWHTH